MGPNSYHSISGTSACGAAIQVTQGKTVLWKRKSYNATTAKPKACTTPAAASIKPTQKKRDQERSPRSRRKWNATLSAAKATTRATTWKRTRWTNPSPQRPPHQKKKDEPKSTINEEEQKPEHAG